VSLEGENPRARRQLRRVVDKSGAWYQYKKDRIGQGKDNAREFLKENPELFRRDRGEDPREAGREDARGVDASVTAEV